MLHFILDVLLFLFGLLDCALCSPLLNLLDHAELHARAVLRTLRVKLAFALVIEGAIGETLLFVELSLLRIECFPLLEHLLHDLFTG